MQPDWLPGIRAFCKHWSHAPMLQQTLEALEREFYEDNDNCICSCRSIVECACQIIVQQLDDPTSPCASRSTNPNFGDWVSSAVQVLGLGDDPRDRAFQKLVSQHHKLTTALGDLRNEGGSACHGRDGFLSKLSIHHRRAAVLSADALVTFLHEAYLESELDPLNSLEPYERFQSSNELIDRSVAFGEIVEDEVGLTVTIVMPGENVVPIAITPSQFLFGLDREAYKMAKTVCSLEEEGPDE